MRDANKTFTKRRHTGRARGCRFAIDRQIASAEGDEEEAAADATKQNNPAWKRRSDSVSPGRAIAATAKGRKRFSSRKTEAALLFFLRSSCNGQKIPLRRGGSNEISNYVAVNLCAGITLSFFPPFFPSFCAAAPLVATGSALLLAIDTRRAREPLPSLSPFPSFSSSSFRDLFPTPSRLHVTRLASNVLRPSRFPSRTSFGAFAFVLSLSISLSLALFPRGKRTERIFRRILDLPDSDLSPRPFSFPTTRSSSFFKILSAFSSACSRLPSTADAIQYRREEGVRC